MDPLYKLERLNQDKQEEYLCAADTYRRAREARAHLPGVRYRLAQGLVAVATRISPAHRALW